MEARDDAGTININTNAGNTPPFRECAKRALIACASFSQCCLRCTRPTIASRLWLEDVPGLFASKVMGVFVSLIPVLSGVLIRARSHALVSLIDDTESIWCSFATSTSIQTCFFHMLKPFPAREPRCVATHSAPSGLLSRTPFRQLLHSGRRRNRGGGGGRTSQSDILDLFPRACIVPQVCIYYSKVNERQATTERREG